MAESLQDLALLIVEGLGMQAWSSSEGSAGATAFTLQPHNQLQQEE